MSDKTPWQKMLKNEMNKHSNLNEIKYSVISHIPEDLSGYLTDDSTIHEFNYPVLTYPEKVKSVNLLKEPQIAGILTGIRGQYLMFDSERVLNVRNHSGFNVTLTF
jgi:hypothetical protein